MPFAYALVGTLITMVVSVLNAYAFARLEFPGRSALFENRCEVLARKKMPNI